jgi:GNAT superfamily N-acetyltransferase
MANIRAAELTEAALLFELVASFPTPTPPSMAAFIAALHTKQADTSSYTAVAELSGKLIGYVSGYSHPTFYAGGNTAWVDELLVVENHRGQGIGRELMEAFEEWAASRECKLIGLATRGARSFYEHLGYQSKAAYYKKYLCAAVSGAAEQRDAADET